MSPESFETRVENGPKSPELQPIQRYMIPKRMMSAADFSTNDDSQEFLEKLGFTIVDEIRWLQSSWYVVQAPAGLRHEIDRKDSDIVFWRNSDGKIILIVAGVKPITLISVT